MLTQFNSASLNRHIAQTYRLDQFSDGFVEMLAAEQTPEGANWFQGTADAVRQATRHFAGHRRRVLPDSGRRPHLPHGFRASSFESHIEQEADITIAAQPVTPDDATQMGIFLFDPAGRLSGFEEKPDAARLGADWIEHAARLGTRRPPATSPFVASMGIYVFSREVLHESLEHGVRGLRPRDHPGGARDPAGARLLYRGYWADVGTVESFYDGESAC